MSTIFQLDSAIAQYALFSFTEDHGASLMNTIVKANESSSIKPGCVHLMPAFRKSISGAYMKRVWRLIRLHLILAGAVTAFARSIFVDWEFICI